MQNDENNHVTEESDQDAGCNCSGSAQQETPKPRSGTVQLTMDGIPVEAQPGDKNLVDVADRAKSLIGMT